MSYLKIFIILFIATLFALSLSYYAEYGQGLTLCSLCWTQRILYFILGGLTLIAFFVPWKYLFLRLIQLTLVAIFLTSLSHSLSEFNKPTCGCTGPSWTLMELPAPLYSAALSLVLLILTQLFLHYRKK